FYGGISDGILAKFNSSGSRIWSTHIGGEGYDDLTNLTLSAQGFLYICGTTKSLTNIASPGAALGTRDPDTNKLLGFLAKFDTLGQRVWCTYLGGDSTTDRYLDIKTTSNNTTGQENIFIYGRVRSTNLGTVGTFGQGYNGGLYDMVLLKYNESGQKQWGSYIGGSQ